MTVPSANSKNKYVGNDLVRNWPFTFQIPVVNGLPDTSVIKVFISDVSGAERELSSSEFEVDLSSLCVVYPKPDSATPLLSTGEMIILKRVVPEVQLLDLENQGHYKAEDIEAEFDDLEMQIQQLREESDRSLKVSIFDENIPDISDVLNACDEAVEARDRAETAADGAEDSLETMRDIIARSGSVYTAGDGIKIENHVISCTKKSASWGNITGNIVDQADLAAALNSKMSASDVDTALSTTSKNPVQNKVITSALNGKFDSSSFTAANIRSTLGNTAVNRAYEDGAGNNISNTYALKTAITPKPTSSSGVGQWLAVARTGESGTGHVLPSGGTWAWFFVQERDDKHLTYAGVSAGGTTVGYPDAAGLYWRIA